MATVLYHLATDDKGNPMNAELLDGNGRLHVVPHDEPTEFASEFLAKKMLEHQAYLGLVEVRQIRTKKGVEYDMEDAHQRAEQSLIVAEKACITDYIMNQLEERVQRNFPPMPPRGRQLACCIKHKYNLLNAGIRLIGWEPPYHMEDPGLGNTPAVNQSDLQQQITMIQGQFLQMQQMLVDLLKAKAVDTMAEIRVKGRGGKTGTVGPTTGTDGEGEDASVSAATTSVQL